MKEKASGRTGPRTDPEIIKELSHECHEASCDQGAFLRTSERKDGLLLRVDQGDLRSVPGVGHRSDDAEPLCKAHHGIPAGGDNPVPHIQSGDRPVRKAEFVVSVTRPGFGKHMGGDYTISSLTFRDEKKARDFYTDMLLKYPDYNVEFLPGVKG